MFRTLSVIAGATLAAPSLAFASTSTDTLAWLAGLFNIFVGGMFVIACIIFMGGLVMWAVRLGVWPSNRDEAIHVMQWGVSTLFTLIVLLGIVEYIENNTETALKILGVIIVILIIWIVIKSGLFSGGGEEKEHE
jgi:uncharacterized membrane protein